VKKINIILIALVVFINLLNGLTVYENAENGDVEGWRVQGDGETPKNIYSPSQNSQVIRLEGRGGPWILGAISGDLAWNNTKEKTISWKMVMGGRYTVYIPISTTNGTRYLFYNDLPKRILRHGVRGGILHGLGGYNHSEYKNVWRTYTRDLEADLKDSEPDNELISVNGFIYSGADVSLDNILLYNPTERIYEDGSTADRWTISDNIPEGATIRSINDPQGEHVQGLVIELNGSKLDNAYKININNSTDEIIQWKSRFYETYSVSLMVQTTNGARELLYTNSNRYTPSGGLTNGGTTIWHEMGGRSLMGQNGWEQRRDFGAVNHFWQTVTRDLNQDIKDFEPNNTLVSVTSFEVRGSGLIDDIKMFSRAVVPNPKDDIVYEDGEDGTISKWHIYDNNPSGATITNITDPQKGKVISFNGNGFENGYEIGARRGDGKWNNQDHKAMSWSIKFNEYFSIYVAIETANGARYLTYEPRDKDRGIIGSYIRFGLGSDASSGEWKNYKRNIEDDLHKFEPDNRLIAINALLVRGSGLIDDVKSMFEYKTHLYEDAEDGNINDWQIMSGGSGDANITNVYDVDKKSRVISLQGMGKSDGYMFGRGWNNKDNQNLKWSMNFNEDYTIYISVQTTNGRRYLTYTPRDDNRGLKGNYILIGLGANSNNGTWQTFIRDLQKDLEEAEIGNRLIAIDSFRVRGSGAIDDIEAF
jgi:hypothetical protein